MPDLSALIEDLWERRADVPATDAGSAAVVDQAIRLLDTGEVRVAEIVADGSPYGTVKVNDWLKKAILLKFKFAQMETIEAGPFEYADKLPLKRDYQMRGVRVVPGGLCPVYGNLFPLCSLTGR